MCLVCILHGLSVVVLRCWIGSKRNLVLAREQLSEMARFNYLGGCVSPGGRVSDSVFARTEDLMDFC